MAKDPAFLFYSNDFLSGTYLMNDEQVGKYIRLLCLQHQKGSLSKKDMLNICKTYDEDIFDKFTIDKDGNYFNIRLKEEFEKRKAYSESRSKNRKSKKVKKVAKTYVNHMEDENENINVIIDKYNNIKNLSKIIKLTDVRKSHIKARLNDYSKDKILNCLDKVDISDFLTGKNDKKWKCDFDWIFNPNNFVKIIEGKYDNKKSNKPMP